MGNLMIESDYQIVINSILDKTKVRSQIISHVRDIINLTSKFKSIHFRYCNKNANQVIDGSKKGSLY